MVVIYVEVMLVVLALIISTIIQKQLRIDFFPLFYLRNHFFHRPPLSSLLSVTDQYKMFTK